jgi:beta-xylosidase
MSNNIFYVANKFGPIITQNMFDNDDGNNINGPSLIKVPTFVKNPLGKYYLYFAHHRGKYIRMAYSDSITGPYTIYKNGVLHLNDTPGV